MYRSQYNHFITRFGYIGRWLTIGILFAWLILIPGHAVIDIYYRPRWFIDYNDAFLKTQTSSIDEKLLIIGIIVLLYALIKRWNWEWLTILAICILAYTVYVDAKKTFFNQTWYQCSSTSENNVYSLKVSI